MTGMDDREQTTDDSKKMGGAQTTQIEAHFNVGAGLRPTATAGNTTAPTNDNVPAPAPLLPRAPASSPGRVMALDLGDVRIGIALSDEGRRIGAPFGVIRRRSRAEDYERYGRLIDEQRVTLVVVGLPVTMAGHEGDRAAWARDYAAGLAEHISVPVVLWDERLTTVEAEAALRAQGRRGKKLRAEVDAAAAALILQSYLDDSNQETHP